MYYNARWYDPALGRFAQADSIVPAGVQGWDRYAYVNNNPVRYTDPSGHIPFVTPRTTCDLDCWRAQNQDESEQDSCTYHLCSNVNLYELGWNNFSQAWSIWTNPNATYTQRFAAGAYMGAWAGAHTALAVGVAGLACAASGPACVTAVEGVLGIGAVSNTVCGGDMCASEVTTLTTYYPPNMGFQSNPSLTTLKPGTLIDRFGSTYGSFLSPAGTLNWQRALPPGVTDLPLKTYQVIKPITVLAGKAAAWFGQAGGGVQYYLGSNSSVQGLLDAKYIIDVTIK